MTDLATTGGAHKRVWHPTWEAMLAVILVGSLLLGRLLSSFFLSGGNLSNVLLDITEISLMALPMTFIIVDLPEPLGPMMATYSPRWMVRLTPSRARTSMSPIW